MKEIDPKEVTSLDGLTDLELKTLALHFSPKRTDCVELEYHYLFTDSGRVLVDGYTDITDEVKEMAWSDIQREYADLPNPRTAVLERVKQHLI